MRLFHLVLFAATAACDPGPTTKTPATGDTGSPSDADLAIVGSYLDGFGSEHLITNDRWTQTFAPYAPSVFEISQFDNTERMVIAQNGEANLYEPSAWSRFDWTEAADGHLYYCQTTFSADSERGAIETAAPDATDPAAAGCGGFSWTDLTP